MKRVVSTLLVQLDDIPPHVIILGATNHPGMIDKAVWRRFAVRVNLPNPETVEYERYLHMAFERYGHRPVRDLEILAYRLEAENFAEAEVFVEDCIRRWIRADEKITIDEAIDLSINGWAKTREKLPT
jgi:SpoVK/Ycf46/Vps4 family AAA+-type ATPase